MFILETKRLILREMTFDDFSDLKKVIGDKITMSHYPKTYDDEGVNRWLKWSIDNYQKYGFGLWAVILKDNHQFIGDCGITMQNINGEICPEIGYHINRDYWQKGYAKEASQAVKDWFFKNTNYDQVYSYMNKDNIASQNTAKANGMKLVKEYLENDIPHCVYMISRLEWENNQI